MRMLPTVCSQSHRNVTHAERLEGKLTFEMAREEKKPLYHSLLLYSSQTFFLFYIEDGEGRIVGYSKKS